MVAYLLTAGMQGQPILQGCHNGDRARGPGDCAPATAQRGIHRGMDEVGLRRPKHDMSVLQGSDIVTDFFKHVQLEHPRQPLAS
jgi:hypothetical protein